MSYKDILYSMGKQSQYFIITINGVQPLKTVNHYIVHLQHVILYISYTKCSTQLLSHVWLYSPMVCSSPGSSNHEVFQTRIPEWVDIFYTKQKEICQLRHLWGVGGEKTTSPTEKGQNSFYLVSTLFLSIH